MQQRVEGIAMRYNIQAQIENSKPNSPCYLMSYPANYLGVNSKRYSDVVKIIFEGLEGVKLLEDAYEAAASLLLQVRSSFRVRFKVNDSELGFG
jgi:hypothetical protein